ncbi:MAG: class II aldolase/adducin family protein [Anaerolineales bacterium]
MKSAEKRERKLIKQIVYTNRICVEDGLIRSSDGNISIRLEADRFLISPSGLYKRRLKCKQILVVNGQGELIRGKGSFKPSSELLMHLEAYRQREDINAVLHAHPPYATALTIAGIPFPNDIVPEVLALLGEVATAPYAAPGTQDLALSIRDPIKNHNTVLLSNHGSLTVGKTLEQALIALERMELAAQLYFLAYNLGKINPLPESEIKRLKSLSAA